MSGTIATSTVATSFAINIKPIKPLKSAVMLAEDTADLESQTSLPLTID